MAKKLARYVTVGGKTYGPDDEVPAEVLDQIKSPKAFVPQGEAPKAEDYSDKDGGTAGGAKLAGPVTVAGKTYGPKDHIPDDVARQIKNPKAWEGGKVPSFKAAAANTGGQGENPNPDTDPDQGDNPAPDGSDTGGSEQKPAPRKSTSSTKRP